MKLQTNLMIMLTLLSNKTLVSNSQSAICAKGNSICIPEVFSKFKSLMLEQFILQDYSKFDLPNETQTVVNVGIDIKDIPKIADKEFSVTLNAFFVVRWKDERLVIDQVRTFELSVSSQKFEMFI